MSDVPMPPAPEKVLGCVVVLLLASLSVGIAVGLALVTRG